ncbi:unnamed protein product, partial [Allacma fusca]
MASPSPYELKLLARENKLDQAELMLRKHMKWRNEVNFDQLLLWDVPKQCQELLPEIILGFDNDNCPVILSPNGKWDIRKVLQEVGPETALLARWRNVKTIQEAMKNKLTSEGVPVTQYNVIADLEGLSMAQGTFAALRMFSESVQMFEANFPEYSKLLIVINAPWFFPMFYKCIKPFVAEKTAGKIHIYGKNRKEWMEFLVSIFPVHVIPKVYGGSNGIEIPLLQQ